MLADDIDSDDMLPKLNSTSEEEDMEGDMEEDMEGDMDDFELKLNDTTEEEED